MPIWEFCGMGEARDLQLAFSQAASSPLSVETASRRWAERPRHRMTTTGYLGLEFTILCIPGKLRRLPGKGSDGMCVRGGHRPILRPVFTMQLLWHMFLQTAIGAGEP
jgi:hypothetical protein